MDGQPSQEVLAQARSQIEALRQSGLSREAILALFDEAHQQTPSQQQSPLSQSSPEQIQLHQQQQQQTPTAAQAVPHLRQGELGHPQFRGSISSTVSTSSDRDSIFTQASGRSSLSLTTQAADSKFWCTSCDKTFKRKFDWKRHEEEFHERWRKYPCPNCNQSFWGPNTFNQHHKSAHGCKSCPHSDTVVKYMRKRKAWGCGFCAAMHGKFEKHIDHVASHFEAGTTKTDWLHSNVIYGLLHQHGVHEAWKDLIVKKQHKFNGHQPMFSWSPESTGRAQGFVENENPGQLQDFLEFFDGSTEAADRIVRLAWGCVHVVLRPKPAQMAPGVGSTLSTPPPTNNSHKHVPITSLQPHDSRRSVSTPSVQSGKTGIKRTASSDEFVTPTIPSATPATSVTMSDSLPTVIVSPPLQPVQQEALQESGQQPQQQFPQQPYQTQMDASYHNFFHTAAQPHGRVVSLDKALPPAPITSMTPLTTMSSVSPMDVEYSLFEDPSQGLMIDSNFSNNSWHSLGDTIIEDHPMTGNTVLPGAPHTQHGFPMGWGGSMGQFAPGQGG